MFWAKSEERERRKRRKARELDLRVRTPLIVALRSCFWLRRSYKKLILAALVLGAFGYLFVLAKKHFYQGDEFLIRELAVTNFEGKETQVLSKQELIRISGIDPRGSIFAADLDEMEQYLLARPEILAAKAWRSIPSKIEIRVKERKPVAWLAAIENDENPRNLNHGVLLDEKGVSFPCSEGFLKIASQLPVLEVPRSELNQFPSGKHMQHDDAMRALEFVLMARDHIYENWRVDRVQVLNFYQLRVYCTDGVEAIFGMHDHALQMRRFIEARAHVEQTGRTLATIDLIPKKNIPFHCVGDKLPETIEVTPDGEMGQDVDPLTRGILERD